MTEIQRKLKLEMRWWSNPLESWWAYLALDAEYYSKALAYRVITQVGIKPQRKSIQLNFGIEVLCTAVLALSIMEIRTWDPTNTNFKQFIASSWSKCLVHKWRRRISVPPLSFDSSPCHSEVTILLQYCKIPVVGVANHGPSYMHHVWYMHLE